MVKLLDETLTTELPETMVNCSPSLSPRRSLGSVVMVDCRRGDESGCTLTTGATELMARRREAPGRWERPDDRGDNGVHRARPERP